MRRLLAATVLALAPGLTTSAGAAAQTSPRELLDRTEHLLVERAAGVREYSVVMRSAFSEVTMYARRDAGEWRFEHDAAEDDLASGYGVALLGFVLYAGSDVVAPDQEDSARVTLAVDTIQGRIANRLTREFPPGLMQRGAELTSLVLAFDVETSDVLRMVYTGRPEGELEVDEPWQMVFGADMYGYGDEGGVRFPRRLRIWGRGMVPPVPAEERAAALDRLVQRLDELRRLPPDPGSARTIARAEMALELLRTGRFEVEVETADFRINAGPPPGLEVPEEVIEVPDDAVEP